MNNKKNGISVNFNGAAGNQFGKNVFVTIIPFNVVERLLVIFPDVQRKVNMVRVKDIAKYILSGLKTSNYCFLSAVTATSKGSIKYDDNFHAVSLDINSVLSINDGQHRIEGIKLALNTLRNELSNAKDQDAKENLAKKLERLENMCVPVVIFDNMSQQHEQQLFHDLNLLAAKPSKSISLKFDNTDLYNRMAKELKQENEYLVLYGIETEKTQLRDKNTNLMVLSTLRNTISFIISGTDKDKDHKLNDSNYDEMKETVNEVLNTIFDSLPNDCNNRNKYIIGLAVTMQGIGKYAYYLLNNHQIVDWKTYLTGLRNINWKHDNKMWNGYGGNYDPLKEKFVFSGTGGGVNGVCNALIENSIPYESIRI
ncbi:DNA sulfur modification protein DndB [Thermoactinomyces sp. DSM 45891]|uniref:DNA sulfur modification protein DndB n=1 Tax=Thermoactinomyces sp. DSM 45891 TaxID=1761907 RepID=UPI0009216249|nr:DNA sulfur modification protein DndB [Thermoactinomyces sp. DSM 45891]SFX20579.1 DNA sulfur modification protein DndB [Thermoactinomyces sp. DSM 45891]